MCLCFVLLAGDARGVLFHSTSDLEFNTAAPAGDLEGSGWQYHGLWGNFTGVVIGPRHFITAGHVGGSVGNFFIFGGKEYRTLEAYEHSGSDLKIWTICGRFSSHAGRYEGDDETGKALVVFGRGTQRGEEVVVSGLLGDERKGWRWGTSDRILRWGENTVAEVVGDSGGMGPLIPGSSTETADSVGPLLQADFNVGAGASQAHLSRGDSGGGVFIREGSTWKLAGINYAVDGPYNTQDSGDGFDAAIFDEGGLYRRNGEDWSRVSDLPADQPGSFYAIRVSAHREWIDGVLEATATGPAVHLEWAATLDGEYTRDSEAQVDEEAMEIRTTISDAPDKRFFQIESCSQREVSATFWDGDTFVIQFR